MASIMVKNVFLAETLNMEAVDSKGVNLKGVQVITQEDYVRPPKLAAGLYIVPDRWKTIRAEKQGK